MFYFFLLKTILDIYILLIIGNLVKANGSIIPTAYYKKDKNVNSTMLELNRKLYLKDATTESSER